MTDSLATSLRCIECGAASPLGYTLQCPTCGGLLELLYDEPRLRKLGTGAFTGTGLWRYAPVLPIADPAHRVSLGAVTSVVSSGNAGSSIAAYSARAGLRSLIFCYERASAPKMLHMAATATDLVIYKGVYDDLITLWDRLAEEGLFFDCGASRNPYKHEGKKTIAYEIAEGLGWRAPDLVVAPVAVGETFIAASRGFAEMERLGLIARRPIMAAAQAARANAVVRAWRDKAAITPLKIGYTVAEGLAAGDPGRKGDWVLRILRETGGVAGEAEDEEILAAQSLLARTEGIWAGPTGVAALAVLKNLLHEKEVDPAATICVILSETGLKTEAAPPSRPALAFDEASLRSLVREKVRRS